VSVRVRECVFGREKEREKKNNCVLVGVVWFWFIFQEKRNWKIKVFFF